MVTKKRGAAAIAAVVVLGIFLALAGANAIADGSGSDRVSAPSAKPALERKAAARSFQRVPTATPSKSSVKKKLSKLTKAHNKLVRAHNALAREFFNCERVVNVTSYFGYDYNGSIGATSALDFTEPGGAVDEKMVVYIC